ncbi:MAG: glycosyl hydrolase 53 family protein [Bacteroidales bacterium]|nr:glycosyl hydrolase 53 family protein [Bacteroidales bacterium]
MKKKILLSALSIWISFNINLVCGQSITDTIFDRYADSTFAFGADISWGGTNLKDKNGVPKDLLTILKEQGLNSVRYRVWYPADGPSGKNQVVRQSKEAHDMGFKVMIDFHYSDSWADPGKQYIPSAWAGHTTEQLIQDVYDHTYDVLDTLKKAGVIPAWVQIGNETKRGMLWPNGNTDNAGGMDNFAEMVKSGYKAIKDIDSSIQAIVHLPDADENSLYRWMFDALKTRGVKWDIIGMSAYPRWAHLDWETEIEMSVANMKDMISRYDTKVMVVETGHYWYEPYISNNFLVELMDTMMTFGGLGCFFWEPQAMGGYDLTAWDPATRQPTIAMDAYLGIKHTDPSTLIQVSLDEPSGNAVYDLDQTITMSASANHLNGKIDKVTFYVNNEPVADVTTEPYTFEMTNPGAGIYSIYAAATDSSGVVANSETVIIMVGPVAIFQENADGYCGITNNAGTIDSNHPDYTGTGFINTDNVLGCTVNWTVNFPEPGEYSIQFRYASTSNRPGTVIINSETIGTAAFPSTGAWEVWSLSSVNYTVAEAGDALISVSATTADGLPNIDYMSIISLESTTKTEASAECLNQTSNLISTDTEGLFTIFPVPAKTTVWVKSTENLVNICIYSPDGTMVKTVKNVHGNLVEIPCSDMVPGLYIIQTLAGEKTYIRKFNILK